MRTRVEPDFSRWRLNSITPFTYRDGLTYLEVIEALRLKIADIVELTNSQNDVILGFTDDVESLIAQLENNYDGLLSRLVGYTIQVGEDTYTAEMMDGSPFTAYTLTGTDKAINANVDPKLAQLSTSVNQLISDFTNDANQLIANFQSTVSGELNAFKTDVSGDLSVFSSALVENVRKWPRHYGAVGDGIADDTAALNAWATDGWGTFEPGYKHKISRAIEFNGDNRIIDGNGCELTLHGDGNANRATAIVAYGDHVTVTGVKVRGVGDCRRGIDIRGDFATVENCDVASIESQYSAYGIRVIAASLGGARIVNNSVSTIYAFGNGVWGDEIGAARGIQFHCASNTIKVPSIISGNTVESITGEEGDGIYVIVYNPGTSNIPFGDGHVTVSNNTIKDCTRRNIKVQSSNNTITGNVIRNDIASASRTWSIDSIQSHTNNITNNTITNTNPDGIVSGIHVVGAGGLAGYCNILNNRVKMPRNMDTGYAVYFDKGNYSVIDGNTSDGGFRCVSVGNLAIGSVSDNVATNLPGMSVVHNTRMIYIASTSDRVMMNGNRDLSWAQHVSFLNEAPNSVSKGNYAINPNNPDVV